MGQSGVRTGGVREAFGHPGDPPRWTSSRKDAIGTAYNTASTLWYTLSHGIVNEVYYPTVDRPQLRDLGFLVTDGEFVHEERRDLVHEIAFFGETEAPGFSIVSSDPEGRYRLVKEVMGDPHLPALLLRVRLEAESSWLSRLRLFVFIEPHLDVGGLGNHLSLFSHAGKTGLVGWKNGVWLALGATIPFRRLSCGFVGRSDGLTDLLRHRDLAWSFDRASDGNVAGVGELAFDGSQEFTVALSFGTGEHGAVTTLFQSMGIHFIEQKGRFLEQWARVTEKVLPLGEHAGDGGRLFRISHNVIRSHEDKLYPGAIIASQSIPWGEVHDDQGGLGGYHLVWTRDLCHSATGLLALGDAESPYRALVYLAASQLPDGGFHQNFWVDGTPYWTGIQLDGVAHPIILAWRLYRENGLKAFDPWPMVRQGAAYLVRHGPSTQQDRWEEARGYSPSTFAAMISALVLAGEWAKGRGETQEGEFFQDYADFLESRLDGWTATRSGTLVPGVPRHYVRILPTPAGEPSYEEDVDRLFLDLANRPPGARYRFPAKEIVDGGFLELVRYGVRRADDPLVRASVNVCDAVLRVETPFGPSFRRYNNDGYGQLPDGGAFQGWGQGRAWPLLTGERGHYELAAGADPSLYIRAMEGFATAGGLIPEQVWDEPDLSLPSCQLGRATGAANPLVWAHAEYIRLLRSVRDGEVFDRLAPVYERYRKGSPRKDLEIWKFNRQVRTVRPGETLRILALAPFRLRYSLDGWRTAEDREGVFLPSLGGGYLDIPLAPSQRAPVFFTFYWMETGRWEGRDFTVEISSG
ncbi:MAG: glycoside hydrolase family 15 protein [Leptospirales bacterium]